jgi:hypothetical protein
MSEFAPGKRVKIIFSVWNLAGIEGNFGTLKERDGRIIGDWAVDVEFPGALNEVVYFEEYQLELVEDAPTDTPAPIAATTVGAGRKPTYEELQAENALMAGRIEGLTGELEKEREAWRDVQRRIQDATDQLKWASLALDEQGKHITELIPKVATPETERDILLIALEPFARLAANADVNAFLDPWHVDQNSTAFEKQGAKVTYGDCERLLDVLSNGAVKQ